jgi:hypothetical protein
MLHPGYRLRKGFVFWIKEAKTEKQKALENAQQEIILPHACRLPPLA